jgi:hypothetical protein
MGLPPFLILPLDTIEEVTDWSQIGLEKGKKAKKERTEEGTRRKRDKRR